MDKRYILGEITRIAKENGGKAPGREKFERETGIKVSVWYPHLWLRWGDALQEAGFSPNKLQAALGNEVILEKYIALIRELGRIPVHGELVRKSKNDPLFPSARVFEKFGGKKQIVAAVAEYCRTHHGFDDILAVCEQSNAQSVRSIELHKEPRSKIKTGFVYLMQSGRHYKIGRTNSLGRREWELGIKIPVPPKTIHSIETDDPIGVEAYWHKRFAEKRGEGEWFDLSPEDIKAFKRWKRIV